MSFDPKDKKPFPDQQTEADFHDFLVGSGEEDTDQGDQGSQGSQSGQIEFHDFLTAPGQIREKLPPDEIKRLLKVHAEHYSKLAIEKQKERRAERAALKAGRLSLQAYRKGNGTGGAYGPTHPVLGKSAQFSGVIDKQVNNAEMVADTNQEQRDELDYQYRLRHAPGAAPRFNPRPQR